MKFVNQSSKRITGENIIDIIADAAHSCYNVEPKDHENNLKFVTNLRKIHHLSTVEHGVVYFQINNAYLGDQYSNLYSFKYAKFINSFSYGDTRYFSMSLRPLIEYYDNNRNNDGEYIPLMEAFIKALNDEDYTLITGHKKIVHEDIDDLVHPVVKNLTAEYVSYLSAEIRRNIEYYQCRVITDRAIANEFERHRMFSYLQSSTRYINYSKEKNGAELYFIKPVDYEENKGIYDETFSLIEKNYLKLTSENNSRPENARDILPCALSTQLNITGVRNQWEHVFELRTAKDAHPKIQELCNIIKKDFYSDFTV